MSENKMILSNGIVIEDQRHLGCGILISNQDTQYVSLGHTKKYGFFLSMHGKWITIDEYPEFYKELDSMRLALVEATQLLKN